MHPCNLYPVCVTHIELGAEPNVVDKYQRSQPENSIDISRYLGTEHAYHQNEFIIGSIETGQ